MSMKSYYDQTYSRRLELSKIVFEAFEYENTVYEKCCAKLGDHGFKWDAKEIQILDFGGNEGGGYFEGGLFLKALRTKIPSPNRIHYWCIDSAQNYSIKERFIKNCENLKIEGRFIGCDAKHINEMFKPASFDLIVCFDALYHFPEVIPVIPDFLTLKGFFAVVTNSEDNLIEFRRCVREAIKRWVLNKKIMMEKITSDGINYEIGKFSCETGLEKLQPCFSYVEKHMVEKYFTLQNTKAHIVLAREYIKSKKKLLTQGLDKLICDNWNVIMSLFDIELIKMFDKNHKLEVSRNDCIFIAKK